MADVEDTHITTAIVVTIAVIIDLIVADVDIHGVVEKKDAVDVGISVGFVS